MAKYDSVLTAKSDSWPRLVLAGTTLHYLSLISSLFLSCLSSLSHQISKDGNYQIPQNTILNWLGWPPMRGVGLGSASLCIPWGVWVGKSLWDRHIGDLLYSYFTSRSSTSRSRPWSNSDIAPDRACFNYSITTTAQWGGSALLHILRASAVGFGFCDSSLPHSFFLVMGCLFLSLCIMQIQIHFHYSFWILFYWYDSAFFMLGLGGTWLSTEEQQLVMLMLSRPYGLLG